jgi:hypothetical protein
MTEHLFETRHSDELKQSVNSRYVNTELLFISVFDGEGYNCCSKIYYLFIIYFFYYKS